MRVGGGILDSRIWENYKTNMFSYFLCGFKIKPSVTLEHVKNDMNI